MIRCQIEPEDRIEVEVETTGGSFVPVRVARKGEMFGPFNTLFLSAADARKLRKQLKRAIAAVEAEESDQ